MNKFEMFLKLLENPKRMGTTTDSNSYAVYFDGYCFRWKDSDDMVSTCYYPYEEWQIIEPQKKLKEMDFGEAYYILHTTDDVYVGKLKSVITDKAFDRSDNEITKEEYMGKWTVEGIYEESGGE